MRITDDNVHGRTVLTTDGIAIGEVNKIFLDSASFTVSNLEVRLRKEPADTLGFKHGVFHHPTIEIPKDMIQSIGDAVLLAVTLDELRALRAKKPDQEEGRAEQPAHT